MEKINHTKSLFFENINAIDKSLDRRHIVCFLLGHEQIDQRKLVISVF